MFSFFRKKPIPKIVPSDPTIFDKPWVKLPDGRLGVIDHEKADGKMGVRPIKEDTFEFYPNTSEHWTWEQRLAIPEEIALTASEVTFINPPK